MTKSKVFGIKQRRRKASDRLNSSLEDVQSLLDGDNPEHENKLLKTKKKRLLKEIDILETKKNFSRKNK